MKAPFWASLFLLSFACSAAFAEDPTSDSKGWAGVKSPSENECRSYIEAALKEQRFQGEAGGDEGGGTENVVEEVSSSFISDGHLPDSANQVIEETKDEAPKDELQSSEQKDSIEETTGSAEGQEGGNVVSEASVEQTDAGIESSEGAVESSTQSGEDIQTETSGSEEKTPDSGVETEAKHDASAEGSVEESDHIVATEGSAEDTVETTTAEESVEEVEHKTDEIVEDSGAESVEEGESSRVPRSVDDTASVERVGEETAETSVEESGEPTEGGAQAEASLEQDVASVEEGQQPSTDEQANVSGESAEEPTTSAEGEVDESVQQSSVEDVGKESAEAEPTETTETVEDKTESLEQPSETVTEAGTESTEQTEEVKSEETESSVTGESPAVTEGQEASAETAESVETTEDATRSVEVEERPATEEVPVEEQVSQESQEPLVTEDTVVVEEPTVPATEVETTGVEEKPVEEAPRSTESTEQEVAPAPSTEPEKVGAEEEQAPEQEDLTLKIDIPDNLRARAHLPEILRLDTESADIENKLLRAEDATLKELKRVYENAIKPLEVLYKYRDLSNRHFGDPEIFSKPLILFMGPWSGGKSTIINYLLDNEYKPTALRSGAEPSPAYFNIVMWGERDEILDGTQLAADWTFSGLQKFGQGLLDRLRGLKMNNPLLEKANIVEIPGILEIRKQVERMFPLNDACQWFIDRADIIFLVYDPAKLDVGPETEAILDQLKGREYQTRIILNKADQVKPEELMRVQGTLIWNISPLMSSTEPPVMYSTSLWSHPYRPGSPSRLLFAQEKTFLKDLREAIDKRVENKISSARRFAVRVRNHAKMVDCYLTTYYNHKTFFGDKQKVSEDIIEHPQNYHIYEGLSTLTNISRYDLPDPDVYRDFFRLNPVYEFQQLASTCTYFKGCPINRLDVAIAYDLPELVGRYKKMAQDILKSYKSPGKK